MQCDWLFIPRQGGEWNVCCSVLGSCLLKDSATDHHSWIPRYDLAMEWAYVQISSLLWNIKRVKTPCECDVQKCSVWELRGMRKIIRTESTLWNPGGLSNQGTLSPHSPPHAACLFLVWFSVLPGTSAPDAQLAGVPLPWTSCAIINLFL